MLGNFNFSSQVKYCRHKTNNKVKRKQLLLKKKLMSQMQLLIWNNVILLQEVTQVGDCFHL